MGKVGSLPCQNSETRLETCEPCSHLNDSQSTHLWHEALVIAGRRASTSSAGNRIYSQLLIPPLLFVLCYQGRHKTKSAIVFV